MQITMKACNRMKEIVNKFVRMPWRSSFTNIGLSRSEKSARSRGAVEAVVDSDTGEILSYRNSVFSRSDVSGDSEQLCFFAFLELTEDVDESVLEVALFAVEFDDLDPVFDHALEDQRDGFLVGGIDLDPGASLAGFLQGDM